MRENDGRKQNKVIRRLKRRRILTTKGTFIQKHNKPEKMDTICQPFFSKVSYLSPIKSTRKISVGISTMVTQLQTQHLNLFCLFKFRFFIYLSYLVLLFKKIKKNGHLEARRTQTRVENKTGLTLTHTEIDLPSY